MKPAFLKGYPADYAELCERLLVTLLRGVGPLRDSMFLMGGLTPRYLVRKKPPYVPAHAGTLDVDIVLDVQLLSDIDAYRTLKQNLYDLGFERASNYDGKKVSWRWTTKVRENTSLVLELLTDDPERSLGRVQEIKGEGGVSALNIPHSSMVFELFETAEVTAELLGGNGKATVSIRHADVVSFTTLKALAFEDRNQRKDAHDLVYCLRHHEGGLEQIIAKFRAARTGKHRASIDLGLDVLRRRFATHGGVDGFEREGPVAAARFESTGEEETPEEAELRILRQREASDLVERLLAGVFA